jgi:polysaccharide biosynthesis/export protein
MKTMRTVLAALLLPLALGNPLAAEQTTAPSAAQAPAIPGGPYQIAAGDVLDIVVWRIRELTMTVTVRPDGWISYPVAGELRAAGVTPTELQRRLEKALGESVLAPAVTVLVTRVAGFKVSILGKVRQPGRYDVHESTTILDVLAQAGGPNDYADPDQMYVLRRTRPDASDYLRIPVRYSMSVTAGKDSPNVVAQPGDIIIVP